MTRVPKFMLRINVVLYNAQVVQTKNENKNTFAVLHIKDRLKDWHITWDGQNYNNSVNLIFQNYILY